MPPSVRLALVGDYDSSVLAHRAIPEALRRASDGIADCQWKWVATEAIVDAPHQLGSFDGLWCVPASPYANPSGALDAIRFVRESCRPFLGTCGGFQHALLEYAQAVWNIASPAHAETNPQAVDPVIAPLACSLVEQSGEIRFPEGSKLAAIYGGSTAIEQYHCRYGLSSRYVERLRTGFMRASGFDGDGEVRAIELQGHPFFIATLFQPERSALAGRDHPLIQAFVGAAQDHAERVAPRVKLP